MPVFIALRIYLNFSISEKLNHQLSAGTLYYENKQNFFANP